MGCRGPARPTPRTGGCSPTGARPPTTRRCPPTRPLCWPSWSTARPRPSPSGDGLSPSTTTTPPPATRRPAPTPGSGTRLGRPPTELPPIAPEIRSRVDAALRVLPSRGWTGGLFGQRDRCLLVLSQLARIPHQHLATPDRRRRHPHRRRRHDHHGRPDEHPATRSRIRCCAGPARSPAGCTTHQVIVTKIATRAIAEHVDEATPLTSQSSHVCREPFSVDDRAASDPLLAPVNQWGHAPFPLNPMTPHAVSRQARDLLEGIVTVHRDAARAPPDRRGEHGAGTARSGRRRLPHGAATGRVGPPPSRHRQSGRRRRRPGRSRPACRRTGPADHRPTRPGHIVKPLAPNRISSASRCSGARRGPTRRRARTFGVGQWSRLGCSS